MSATVKRKGWIPLEIGGTVDHVHILVQGGPMDTIPSIVGSINSYEPLGAGRWWVVEGIGAIKNLHLPMCHLYVTLFAWVP